MKWPTAAEQHAYMKMRQDQNLAICWKNSNEAWMAEKLEKTGWTWKRQAQWGYRLFDFWNFALGIAVEVDGLSHNKSYDAVRDAYNLQRSGILVLRVRNRNEEDARRALTEIEKACLWNERRVGLGLKPVRIPHPQVLERRVAG